MTIVLSARRRITARRHTAPFTLVDLTPQTTMITMIGIRDNLRANYGEALLGGPLLHADLSLCDDAYREGSPTDVACRSYGIFAGSHDYSKLVVSLSRTTVWGCLVENPEPAPRQSRDALSEPTGGGFQRRG